MSQTNNEAIITNRRGRFIVLGSSGECLPVNRHPLREESSNYTSCESSEEEFHSAKNSLDEGKTTSKIGRIEILTSFSK